MTKRRLACLALAVALVPLLPATARADGAASTRNILLGGAAATLLIINHNRKVHQKYAEYDRRQAETQAQANNAEAAYQSERSAYAHEAALVAGYQHEVAVQHRMVLALRHQLVVARRSGPAGSRPLVAGAPSNPAAPPLGWGTL